MSELRTQTICIILVMLYEGSVQSLCRLQNCAAFEAAPARSMQIRVSEVLAVGQLSSSFSPAEEENSANIALSQDYFYGYLGRYDRNRESKWKQNIFHRKREKLFHAREFRSWFIDQVHQFSEQSGAGYLRGPD